MFHLFNFEMLQAFGFHRLYMLQLCFSVVDHQLCDIICKIFIFVMAFCYWQIKNNLDLIVACLLILCSLMLTIFSLFNLAKYLRQRHKIQIQRSVKILLIIMPLWGIAHISKLMFGILGYSLVFKHQLDGRNYVQDDIQVFSSIFCVVDSISTMLLHSLLLLVPYVWLFNILICITSSPGESPIKISRYTLITGILKKYMFARYLIYSGLFILQLLMRHQQVNQTICMMYIRINSSINLFIILESCLAMALFLLCLFTLLNHLQYIKMLKQSEKGQLLREFVIISIFCLIRFFINLFFIELSDQQSCQFNTNNAKQIKHTVIYLAIGILATHFIPIILLYRTFKVKIQDKANPLLAQENKQKEGINDTMSEKSLNEHSLKGGQANKTVSVSDDKKSSRSIFGP